MSYLLILVWSLRYLLVYYNSILLLFTLLLKLFLFWPSGILLIYLLSPFNMNQILKFFLALLSIITRCSRFTLHILHLFHASSTSPKLWFTFLGEWYWKSIFRCYMYSLLLSWHCIYALLAVILRNLYASILISCIHIYISADICTSNIIYY